MKIPTFVINLPKRSDRKKHVLSEFENRNIFELNVFKAIEMEIGAVGLWKSMRKIVEIAVLKDFEMVLICEDDHMFTEFYSEETLVDLITTAKKINADIFLGGISGFEDCVVISENMAWVNKFSGAQFMIVFNKFYKAFLNIELKNTEDIDLKLGQYTDLIFISYPFISIQKSFGYSDVTARNNEKVTLERHFENTIKRIEALKKVENHFLNQYY